MSSHFSPLSNPPRIEANTLNPKVNHKLKSKTREASASHGRQHTKAVGNKPPRENYAIVRIPYSTNPSFSHHDLGVVRSGANASLESHLSPNSRKPKARVSTSDRSGLVSMGQPLVEIPIGHSNKGKRGDNGVESTTANFMGWRALPLTSLDRLLLESNLLKEVQTRKIMADGPTETSLVGSSKAIKVIQYVGDIHK